jgi:hypothetical protein
VARPTTTTTIRSAVAGMDSAIRAPIHPPTRAPAASRPTAFHASPPWISPEPAGAQDRVGEGQPQNRQQHDAQAGAEVTAVDRRGERASGQQEGPRPGRGVRGATQRPPQEGLEGEQDGRTEDQPGGQGPEEGR